MENQPMHFEQDLKPLFRATAAMRGASPSSSGPMTTYPPTPTGSSAGSVPCDRARPAERLAVFRQWIDAGMPA
jgi:hypothetical protein